MVPIRFICIRMRSMFVTGLLCSVSPVLFPTFSNPLIASFTSSLLSIYQGQVTIWAHLPGTSFHYRFPSTFSRCLHAQNYLRLRMDGVGRITTDDDSIRRSIVPVETYLLASYWILSFSLRPHLPRPYPMIRKTDDVPVLYMSTPQVGIVQIATRCHSLRVASACRLH